MIDYRLKTFLTLCELKNYTKTAKKLFITQPAVTQQIKYLEKYYGVTLFKYEGKNLILTPAGKELQSFALTLSKDCEKIVQKLSTNKENITYKFGATLTIGQYIMPDIIEYILKENLKRRYVDLKICSLIDEKKYDVFIITAYYTWTGQFALYLLKSRKIEYWFETDGAFIPSKESAIKRLYKRLLIKGASKYLSPSETTDEY